ncbi:putative transcription factor TGA like domain-containing protein [Helianthus annuus]|nr:putative transcription factor TGA like domain-containing protein [Helianthus annuus]
MSDKAYVQQLETCRLKLVQLEQELERSRQQGVCGSLLNTSNGISSSNINSGIAAFEIMYDLWVFEQRKRDNELKIMLQNQVSEPDLRISVDSSLNHYYELFQMKANAMKTDVFYFMCGMWRKPIERLFQWLGGPRPLELICVRWGYLLILIVY